MRQRAFPSEYYDVGPSDVLVFCWNHELFREMDRGIKLRKLKCWRNVSFSSTLLASLKVLLAVLSETRPLANSLSYVSIKTWLFEHAYICRKCLWELRFNWRYINVLLNLIWKMLPKLFEHDTGWYWDGWPSSGGHTTSVYNQPCRPTQPPTLCRTGNKYRPKCGDVLRLGIKGRTAHSIRG